MILVVDATVLRARRGLQLHRRVQCSCTVRDPIVLFEELFAEDFVDHTPQPNTTPDKDGVRILYHALRAAFPDFRAEIHWQTADKEIVTTYKTYHGTHQGTFLGVAPTGRKIHFETVDAMRVHDGKITEHWGVANLFSLMQQLGAWPPATRA